MASLASRRFDIFTVGIPIALGLALVAPRMGVSNGPLHVGYITDAGIVVPCCGRS